MARRRKRLPLRCRLRKNQRKRGFNQKKDKPRLTLWHCWEQLVSFTNCLPLAFHLFYFPTWFQFVVQLCHNCWSICFTLTSSQLIPSFENFENVSKHGRKKFLDYENAKNFPLREEADADDRALRFHHLHWNCCNFLFWFTLNLILWTNLNLFCSWCLQVLQNKLFKSEAKWYLFIMILGYIADSFTSSC